MDSVKPWPYVDGMNKNFIVDIRFPYTWFTSFTHKKQLTNKQLSYKMSCTTDNTQNDVSFLFSEKEGFFLWLITIHVSIKYELSGKISDNQAY